MGKVAIVTDSAACLPANIVEAHRITTVPLAFLFDGKPYQDGRLSGREFFALLRSSRKFPSTAAPAPGDFLEAFRQRARDSHAALCITLPASYSATFDAARAAADLARDEMPRFPIRVVDSHCLAMSHGFAALSAARAAEGGATMDEAEEVAREVASRAHLVGAMDTMRYLAKSGRVPLVAHWATSLLQLKPILATSGEEVHAVARVRTMRRALSRLLVHMERRLDGGRHLHVAVMHADAPAAAAELAETIRQRFQPEELLITEFTSVMGAHTGPGFVGVSFFSGLPSGTEGSLGTVGSANSSGSTLERDVRTLETSLGNVPAARDRPTLVVVSGLPGSGKSHFSRELARRYPLAHLNSDLLRQRLLARPTHSAAESARLFAAIHVLAQRLLSKGVGVILDATSLKEAHRRTLYDIAERTGAGLVVVQTEAPNHVARDRLEARARGGSYEDASEATAAVYDRMKAVAEPIRGPHVRVDTSKDIEPALQDVLRSLHDAGERPPR